MKVLINGVPRDPTEFTPDELQRARDKMLIHGNAIVLPDGSIVRIVRTDEDENLRQRISDILSDPPKHHHVP
jgi:hypothetical protein